MIWHLRDKYFLFCIFFLFFNMSFLCHIGLFKREEKFREANLAKFFDIIKVQRIAYLSLAQDDHQTVSKVFYILFFLNNFEQLYFCCCFRELLQQALVTSSNDVVDK